MYILTIDGTEQKIQTEGGNLREILVRECFLPSDCGGNGHCGKCAVLCDGKRVLACQTEIKSDLTVTLLGKSGKIRTNAGIIENKTVGEEPFFAVDIGTTTVALALCDRDGVCEIRSFDNPQRLFGADVLLRAQSASENGVSLLQKPLLTALQKEKKSLSEKYEVTPEKTFVAGNTTMLHIFWGEDCSSLGTFPYTPKFLEKKEQNGTVSLPGISTYVGSDIVAGLTLCETPKKGANLFIDIGTNAEIALILPDRIYVSATSAGPCFEGGNISCGMPAKEGAITAFSINENGKKEISYIGEKPLGLCGTGLIDVIAELVKNGIIDSTGYLKDEEGYLICNNVLLTQQDVRAFQLAKSAVKSGLEILLKKADLTIDDVCSVYLAGGFSSFLSVKNAEKIGLLPEGSPGKIVLLGNASLKGTILVGQGKTDPQKIIKKSTFVDLNGEKDFFDVFIKNINF